MCPSLIEIGSKTAEKNSEQTNKQTDRHYENNGHLAVNQLYNMVGGLQRIVLRFEFHQNWLSGFGAVGFFRQLF